MFQRLLLLASLIPVSIVAQSLSAGLKAGLPLTDSVPSSTSGAITIDSASKRYIVGGFLELKLPFRVSVEGDVLYHPFNLRTRTATTTSSNDYSVFEFPIVGKYRLVRGPFSPYIEAGPSFRTHPSSLLQAVGSSGNIASTGFTAGVGIDLKLLLIHVQPEFRYTHWSAGNFITQVGGASDNQNQAAFLVGVSF